MIEALEIVLTQDPEDESARLQCFTNEVECFVDLAGDEQESYIVFIAQSLMLLQPLAIPEPLKSYQPDPEDGAVLMQPDFTQCSIKTDGSNVVLAYLDGAGKAPETRLSPFFIELKCSAHSWQQAATRTLEQVFSADQISIFARHWTVWRQALR